MTTPMVSASPSPSRSGTSPLRRSPTTTGSGWGPDEEAPTWEQRARPLAEARTWTAQAQDAGQRGDQDEVGLDHPQAVDEQSRRGRARCQRGGQRAEHGGAEWRQVGLEAHDLAPVGERRADHVEALAGRVLGPRGDHDQQVSVAGVETIEEGGQLGAGRVGRKLGRRVRVAVELEALEPHRHDVYCLQIRSLPGARSLRTPRYEYQT